MSSGRLGQWPKMAESGGMESGWRPEHEFAPLGSEDASVDPKGRLKLPTKYLEYLKRFSDDRVFVTTLNPNTRVTVVYPISEWRALQNFFAHQASVRSAETRDVLFVADHYGTAMSVDKEGRVLIPQRLRDEFGLASTRVWMSFDRGRFNVWTDEAYQKGLAGALGRIDASLAALEATGRL